jgi:steroid 5-alpha reductase family enzyme
MLTLWAASLAALVIPMFLLWLYSLRHDDVTVVDSFWGPGFSVVALAGLWVEGASPRGLILSLLVAAWGLRLGLYLHRRNHGKGEDARYQKIRAGYGPSFRWKSLYVVFGLQGLLISVVGLPLLAGIASDAPWGPADAVGIGLWVTGFLFESIADTQLSAFKADPGSKGRVMDRGLWRYSRHPNYFGNFCMWWGIGVVALGVGAWFTLVGPVIMSVLLLRVSGVSLLESTITERRPEYRAYQERTSSFFPWFPRR